MSIIVFFVVFAQNLKSIAKDLLEHTTPSMTGSLLRTERFQHAFSLKTVYLSQPATSDPLMNILTGIEDRPTVRLLLDTSWLSGRMKGEGEVMESRPPGPANQDGGTGLQYRLIRFGLTGMEQKFRYGASYRVAGEGFGPLQDQASRELWGEWKMGMLRFRTAVSEQWNNIERDPRRARISGTQEKTIVAIGGPAWPELTISYGRDWTRSSLEPIGVSPQRNDTDTLEAAVFYSRPRWNAKWLSSYSLNNDQLRIDGETVGLGHAVSASYRASERVTIVPTFSLRADRQRWSGVRLDTPSASMALTYTPSRLFNMMAFGSYSNIKSSDGLVDNMTSNMTSVFTWICRETPNLRTTLSLNTSYTAMLDGVQPDRSTEDVSGLLRLQLAGL